ncbi:hypothetical protein [Bradyrhizobium sp. BR 10261]|uniref:hypothetical protein n=1 Tax=Bradyrhizobium sp. BR 10261 TaxID=2749992 RepID=UPI001C64FFFE|nr:hypothetical protein [Bradyrhizobium sp. BR 10261]MBW7964962.1 hypothetical protein [Bradyrhizobium sp. BR 10261]
MTFEVRDFVNMLIDTAEDVAIAESGKPDAETSARLDQLACQLREQLNPVAGPELAGRIVDGFIATIWGAKREREALAACGLLN